MFFYFLILVISAAILANSIAVINEYERAIRFRLGRYYDTLKPGLNFVVPGLDSIVAVDLRTRTLEIPSQLVITRDNAGVSINAIIYYRVIDPKLVILSLQDFGKATVLLAQIGMRNVIGDLTLDEVLTKREDINAGLRGILAREMRRWGVNIQNVEIVQVEPPREIRRAMEKQMTAERTKRAMVLEAEGQREAVTVVAEGNKEATVLVAEGEGKSIEMVANSARKNLKQEALTLFELNTLKGLGVSEKTTFLMPLNMSPVTKKVRGVPAKRKGRQKR